MKKMVTTLCAVAALALVANAAFAAGPIRISQVYSGGGGGSSYFLYDYVELYNNSTSAVNIGNWTLEYGSATGNWGSSATNIYTFPAGTMIQPCSYVLVQAGPVSTAPAAQPLPATPDFVTGNIGMGNTNGKLALFSAVNSNLACGSEIAGTLQDKVAWGSANCSETTAIPAFADQSSVGKRLNAGQTDTDNNNADFTIVAASVAGPHNAASPMNPGCAVTPSMKGTWGQLKSIYR